MENQSVKELIEDYLTHHHKSVIDGRTNALDLKIFIKETKDLMSEIEKDIEEIVQEEAQKWHKQSYSGYDIEYSEGRRILDYKHIPEWQEAKQKLLEVEDKCKAALESGKRNLMAVNEYGLVIEAAKEKFSKPIVKMKKTKGVDD